MKKFEQIAEEILTESKPGIDVNDVFYNYTNDEDTTFAGVIDNLLIQKLYGGDDGKYDETDGYDVRDEIISQVVKAAEKALGQAIKKAGK